MFELSGPGKPPIETDSPSNSDMITEILSPQREISDNIDVVELFEEDLYMSEMHDGHGGGKTSSFKRCVFLEHVGSVGIADLLVTAIETRPTDLCYLHMLQGGGAIGDVAVDSTAFGCRDWEFACVITGVWPRDEDGTEVAHASVDWVYRVVRSLMPVCCGIYGADLGPDPRDDALAVKAFGPNRSLLGLLNEVWTYSNILTYSCPLLPWRVEQKLILLITGKSGAGKDHCAKFIASVITSHIGTGLQTTVLSISDETKQEYSEATPDVDLDRLLNDRSYKEKHRRALTKFYNQQLKSRPNLREEHFLSTVGWGYDSDIVIITGMRDEAPISSFAHLVPDCRIFDIHIEASEEIRKQRRGYPNESDNEGLGEEDVGEATTPSPLAYRPNVIFNNDKDGNEALEVFTKKHMFPLFDEDLQRLRDMVLSTRDHPRPGVEFRHVLGIAHQLGGLALCTSLLRSTFLGEENTIDVIACCEVGGIVFASPLAVQLNKPMALIRGKGKLPPPTISVPKPRSHISSSSSVNPPECLEMDPGLVSRGTSVLVVDDSLASGRTLCAILQLLKEADVRMEDVSVTVVAEFPAHRDRQFIRERGYGGVRIQSLLVFDGL